MNIYVLSTLDVGINSLNILNQHLDIKGVIGLSERPPTDKISGYVYLKGYCEESDLDFIELKSYSLNKKSDKSTLLNLDIDILIVCGWQRLIPSWLIRNVNTCVIGSHGSVSGITKGRGRSPQNWAIIMGAEEFTISIFKIDEGIDSGSIIDTKSFRLNMLDDIKTSYYKVIWHTANMIIENIMNGKIFENTEKQEEEEARYLPQRLPQDGQIDWNRTSTEIYNFVRALTTPYPGSHTILDNVKITIWSGRPFETDYALEKFSPGEIVTTFYNNDFLVRTKDSFFLVENYSSSNEEYIIKRGKKFDSSCFREQMNTIVNRHCQKYPDLEISQEIRDLG